jgi:hypothetical protein
MWSDGCFHFFALISRFISQGIWFYKLYTLFLCPVESEIQKISDFVRYSPLAIYVV